MKPLALPNKPEFQTSMISANSKVGNAKVSKNTESKETYVNANNNSFGICKTFFKPIVNLEILKTLNLFSFFMNFFSKKQQKVYINLPIIVFKTVREVLYHNIKSEIESKVENIGLRGSGWRFNQYLPMRVFFLTRKVANVVSYGKLTKNNQSMVKIKIKDKLRGIYSLLIFSLPPKYNPNKLSNYTKSLPEIKTIGIDLTDGLKVDKIGKLQALDSLSLYVFVLNKDKTLTHLYLRRNMSQKKREDNQKDVQVESLGDKQYDNHKDDFENE